MARVLASVLNKLVIRSCTGADQIKEIQTMMNRAQLSIADTVVKNALKRLQKKLQDLDSDDGGNPIDSSTIDAIIDEE